MVSLPIVARAVEKFARDQGLTDEKVPEVVETNISISYPFAQLGNLTVALFICFCEFFFQSPLTAAQIVLLPVLTLLSTVGTPTVTVNAVGFISNAFQMPAGTENLYMTTSTFTRYGR